MLFWSAAVTATANTITAYTTTITDADDVPATINTV